METRPNSISIRSRRATYLALLRLGDFRLLLIIDQLLGGGGVVLVSRHGNSIFRVSKSSRVKTWRECVRNRVSVGQSAFTTLGKGETHGLVVEPLGEARSISRWSQGRPRARALVVHLTLWRGHCVPSRSPFASQPHDLSVEWSGGPVHAGLARVDLGQAVGGRRSAGGRGGGRAGGRTGGSSPAVRSPRRAASTPIGATPKERPRFQGFHSELMAQLLLRRMMMMMNARVLTAVKPTLLRAPTTTARRGAGVCQICSADAFLKPPSGPASLTLRTPRTLRTFASSSDTLLEELQKESAHERGNYAQSSDASSPPAPWSVRGISMCCEQGVDAMHSMLISLARRSSALLAAWC